MIKYFMMFVCLNISLYGIAQSDVATAKWMHVNADGNNEEWGSLNFYDDRTQLSFGIANDSDNIYLCFAAANETAQMKLMRAGMKITLETKGKPKHEASVLFPLPQNKEAGEKDSSLKNNPAPPQPGETRVFNKETFRENYIARHATMQVSGFANMNGEVPVNTPAIHVAVNWDSASNMIYEIAIAKKEFFGADASAKDILNDITMNIELNGLSRSETGDAKNGEAPRNGMHAGMDEGNMGGKGMRGGGGFNGGGFNGGGRGGNASGGGGYVNNANNVSLNQKTSFKQKFVLNDGKE